MATAYPGAVDTSNLTNPSAGNTTNSPSLAGGQANQNDAIKATQTKVGIGSTTPAANTFLFGTGAGVSTWKALVSADLLAAITDETGTGSIVFNTTPVLITPKIDTINENTPSNGVTVAGLNIRGGAFTSSETPVKAVSFTGNMSALGTITTTYTDVASVTLPSVTVAHKYLITGIFSINHAGAATTRDYAGSIRNGTSVLQFSTWSAISSQFIYTLPVTTIFTSSATGGQVINFSIQRSTDNGGTMSVVSHYSIVDMGRA